VFLGVVMIEAKKVTGRPASIPQWAFGEVFRLRDLGYGCRRIVRSLEEAGVFTTRSSGVRISPASVNTASIQTTRAPALPLESAQGWPPDAQQQGN